MGVWLVWCHQKCLPSCNWNSVLLPTTCIVRGNVMFSVYLSNRVFHSYTKLAMLALLPTLFCSFLLYLHQLILINWKLEIKEHMRIIFQGCMLYLTSWFLIAKLKQSWQCCHSCIREHLWKTRLKRGEASSKTKSRDRKWKDLLFCS